LSLTSFSLPDIKHKVKLHLNKVTRQIANLPELPPNLELEIQASLLNFSDTARIKIDDFKKNFSKVPDQFRDCLLEMKPRITLKDFTDSPVMEISDDDSDAGSVATSHTAPIPKRRNNSSFTTPTNKRQRTDMTPNGSQQQPPLPHASFKAEVGRGGSMGPGQARNGDVPNPFASYCRAGRGFRTLRQVKDEIERKQRAGVPNLIPHELYDGLAMEAVKPWKQPMMAFLKLTMSELQSQLELALSETFGQLKKRYVYPTATKCLHQYLTNHGNKTTEQLEELYLSECEQILTLNKETFSTYVTTETESLKSARHHMRMSAQPRKDGLPPPKHVHWEHLSEEMQAQELKRREAEIRVLGPDPFEREVGVMAFVRGYYRLAALRFADNVFQQTLCRMLPKLRRELSMYLENELGLRGPDPKSVYERLMAEDEATAAKRTTLREEQTKFVTALASIEELENATKRDELVDTGEAGEEGDAVNGADAMTIMTTSGEV
jgi:hypothetical protein